MSSKTDIAASIKGLLATPELPSLGPDERAGTWDVARIRTEVAGLAKEAGLSGARQSLVLSAVLLWHDHLHESHELSQDISSSSGSFLHGIMHRREPDYGNAKYWFTRTGKHESFPEIAVRAGELLDASGESELRDELAPGGRWDSFAMVDAVEGAMRGRRSPGQRALLLKIQQIEFEVLLESFCG